jgi:DNA invertase Pin-like site-specific DNA recombinase
MKRHFAYIRVSTAKQGDGSSLQEQRRAIEAYALKHGLTISAWFEEKETAAKQGRTVFTRMLARLAKREAEGLIIHKIDRSARNLKDWASLGDLIDSGIDVQFAHESMDMKSRGGRLAADIQAVVAADYIRNLRDEVIKGLRGRLNQGLYPFAAPVGYLDRGKGQIKDVDPVQAPLVREAFALYASGTIGLKALRAEMKRRGLTTPRSRQPLSLNGISKMLSNPFYIGIIRIRKTGTTYQGKHEPLVTKAVFDRVQEVLKGKLVIRVLKHDFIFRRIVNCAGCGYHLIGERHKGRYVYYRCQTAGCPPTYIREEILDDAVQTELQFLRWSTEEQQSVRMRATALLADAATSLDEMRAALRLQIGKCDEHLARLTDAYLEGAIERDLFENRKLNVLNNRRSLLDRLENLTEDDLPVNKALEYLELGNAAYIGYKNGINPEKRAMLETVTSNFEVSQKKPMIALKSPWQELANFRKSQLGAPSPSTPRNTAMQLLDIALVVAKAERRAAIEREQRARRTSA